MLSSLVGNAAETATRRRWFNPIARYTRWLHTMWPAGGVEKLPRVNDDYSTNVPGLYIVGDLTGVPLLKFSADSGARAVRTILNEPSFHRTSADDDVLDLLIIGAGISGMAAALEARNAGLRFEILEASEPFSTIVNFPAAKPIYTYPTDMTPAGDLQFRPEVHPKELLIEDIRRQTIEKGIVPLAARAQRIVRKGAWLEVVLTPSPGNPGEGGGEGSAKDQLRAFGTEPSPTPLPEYREREGSSLRARRVIVAIGRSGNFRKLGCRGEDLDKVFNRLHDPKEFAGKDVLVVGGGDSALETAIAIAEMGGNVTLSYRKPEFSRPKPDNIERLDRLARDPSADVQVEQPTSERVTSAVGEFMDPFKQPGSIRLMMSSKVAAIHDKQVDLIDAGGQKTSLPNDVVFTMIGREPPLDFLRRSGVKINGDRGALWWISLIAFLLFCVWLYQWKKTGVTITGVKSVDAWIDVGSWWQKKGWFPYSVPSWTQKLGDAWSRPTNLLGTIRGDLGSPGFYYSFAYCALVVGFGIDRIRRRRTPYVKWQTITLASVQCILLFLVPYILLPWAGHNGWFAEGHRLAPIADQLFERYDSVGIERAYWRSFGFILAWPLFFWNVFTDKPMLAWLIISLVQTFVIIPAIVYFWGKGAYCGWICSCGALAETLGDRHRQKMPHGPFWNRFNMVGQVFLFFAFALLVLRIVAWMTPDGQWYQNSAGQWFQSPSSPLHTFAAGWFAYLFHDVPIVNYTWFVDLLWAGIIGVGLYFWFSGRVWCRFACPLAALMHIYARFSRFRILAEKKKCISCNVCTSVCHQGIDVMNFANKGLPMADPQCVRCSACVQMCPTGVLSFGQIDRKSGKTIKTDPAGLAASPVIMREIGVKGQKVAV